MNAITNFFGKKPENPEENRPNQKPHFQKHKESVFIKPNKNTDHNKTVHQEKSHQENAPQKTSPAHKSAPHTNVQNNRIQRPVRKPRPKSPNNYSESRGTKNRLRAYILGGLNEVGKNCLAIECNDDIIVVDVGMAFPDDEMLGVDFVIPDTTFLEKNKHRVRGLVITHGHLDHIGALQHVLPNLGILP
jgi:ribonuclease J